jgi:hypothetical protein
VVHDEATILTAIDALPQKYVLLVSTAAAGFARIAFIYLDQLFPRQEILVGKHLDEGIQPPIVVHDPV